MRKTVGRYQLKAMLGSGGMAKVYLAFDPEFEREVAIKVLPRDLVEQPGLKERFTREAKVIASLEHSAIVPVYDVGEDEGQPYLVMRYLRGGNLSDRLEKGPIPQNHIVEVLRRMAAALNAAHEHGIIHRDVKPANILYDTHDNPHLSDFGIVKLGDQATTLTGDAVIGTPNYMSPEQALGDRELDSRTDTYSLGVVLFQMLTGHAPYESDTPMGVAVKHVTDPVPSLSELRPDLAEQYDQVISKAMAKDPDERFQSVLELPEAFVKAAASKETVASAKPKPKEPSPTLVPTDTAAPTKLSDKPVLEMEEKRSGPPWLPIGIGGLVLAALVAAVVLGPRLLAGSGGTTVTEVPEPQQVIAAESSPTSRPPTPRPTTAPTPLPPPVVVDDFQGSELGPEWRWIREPSARWNLVDSPGWLWLESSNSSLLGEGGASPVLLRWTAPGHFEYETVVDFGPSSNFQAAGIVAYQDDDHFVALVRAFCDPGFEGCVGDSAYLDNDQAFREGAAAAIHAGDLPAGQPIRLRLVREGELFVGFWGTMSGEWMLVGETVAPLFYPRLGLYANGGQGGAPTIPARFDGVVLSGEAAEYHEGLSAWTEVIPPGEAIRLAMFDSGSGLPGDVSRVMIAAAELALADHGPVHGVDVHLVGYPAGCTEQSGAAAADQLVAEGGIIGLIGPVCSSEARGALPALEAARVVAVSPSTTVPDLSGFGPSVFNRVILHSDQPGSQEGAEASEIPRVQDFYGEFRQRTGMDFGEDALRFAAYSYDATRVLLHALDQVGIRTPDGSLLIDRIELMVAVRSTEGFDGLTGPITLESDGDRAPR